MHWHLQLVSDSEMEFQDAKIQEDLASLIADMSLGNEGALETLYWQTVDQVYRLTEIILGDPSDAEEITEDVYLFVWRNTRQYDQTRGNPIAWILTIARSRAIDRLRYRRRQANLIQAIASEPAYSAVEEDCMEFFSNTEIKKRLEALPELQRQILTLAYFKGMTHAEISQFLSLSLGTVKTHIRRTLSKLRDAVEA